MGVVSVGGVLFRTVCDRVAALAVLTPPVRFTIWMAPEIVVLTQMKYPNPVALAFVKLNIVQYCTATAKNNQER